MDLQKLLYNNSTGGVVGRGSLLIADPMMEEAYFRRAVVMILDVDKDKGHLGLCLNKSTHITLNDIMPEWEKGKEIPVFCGGPVDLDRLFLLHTLGDLFPGSTEIIPGIYVGGDVEEILGYIENGGEVDGKLRFFLGYSGWSGGQLESELSRHSWTLKTPENGDSLLDSSDNEYWRREVAGLGDRFRSWLVVPTDPSLN